MCSNGPSNGKCWSSSVVYKVSCNRCVGQTHSYVGETSRSPYTRGVQHLALYNRKNDTSFMWRHTRDHHHGVIGHDRGSHDFTMKRLSTFKDPLTRIIEEAVEIKEQEDDRNVRSLNSRQEYFGAELVRSSFFKGPIDQ